MEKTSTHDDDYVDIVLGYHHVLLFSLVFGVLIFGTGYFVGFHRARSDQDRSSAVSRNTRDTSQSAATPAASPGLIPQIVTEPFAATDVVQDMEKVSTASVAQTTDGEPETAAAVTEPAPTAAPEAASSVAASPAQDGTAQGRTPQGQTAPPVSPGTKPAAVPAVEVQRAEPSQPVGNQSRASTPASPPRPSSSPAAGGNIYLQVSTFGTRQDAEQLINDLAAEGFRAVIDGTLAAGKHTVLVGPFVDLRAASGQAKELRETNREAFPVRR